MTVALALLGTAFQFTECNDANVTNIADCDVDDIYLPDAWGGTAVGSLMLYVAGYQVGFGPIAWLVISEIFPLKTRGAALSIAAITNFGTNIIATISFQSINDAVGASAQYGAYGFLCLISLCFVWFVVPETKGLSLEEIEGI